VPALPSWLTEPLWNQFAALLPERPTYHPDHPLGCHRPRVSDRIIFDKLLQLLRFGCSYEAIADTTCSATTIRNRRDEWIRLGVFARLKQIALESYDRSVGLVLDQIAVDGSITKAPGGGEVAGRSPVDRGKQALKRSGMTDGHGTPLGRVLAGANRHDSPLLAPTPDHLDDLGPLPDRSPHSASDPKTANGSCSQRSPCPTTGKRPGGVPTLARSLTRAPNFRTSHSAARP
jgi:transposase